MEMWEETLNAELGAIGDSSDEICLVRSSYSRKQAACVSAWRVRGGDPAAGTETTFNRLISGKRRLFSTASLVSSRGRTHLDPGAKSGPLPVICTAS